MRIPKAATGPSSRASAEPPASTTHSKQSRAMNTPTGSINTASQCRMSCSRLTTRRRRKSGVTTVGPVTMIRLPVSRAIGAAMPMHRWAISAAPSQVQIAPLVTRRRITTGALRKPSRSRVRPPSKRMIATARPISGSRPWPSALGTTTPMPDGPSATPTRSRSAMAGNWSRLAITCTSEPAARATPTVVRMVGLSATRSTPT